MSQRTIFVKAGTVIEVSMCDPGYCDEWCRVRGYDGWAPATAELPDVLREVEVGDTISASKRAGRPFELNKATATVTREGERFISSGVRDYAKLRAGQAKAQAKAPQFTEQG